MEREDAWRRLSWLSPLAVRFTHAEISADWAPQLRTGRAAGVLFELVPEVGNEKWNEPGDPRKEGKTKGWFKRVEPQ